MDATSGSREQVLTEERQAQPRPKPTQHRPAELQPVLHKLRSTQGVPLRGVKPQSRPIPESRPRSSHAFGCPGLSGVSPRRAVFARRSRGSLQVWGCFLRAGSRLGGPLRPPLLTLSITCLGH